MIAHGRQYFPIGLGTEVTSHVNKDCGWVIDLFHYPKMSMPVTLIDKQMI
jgi:hypothetical protein